MSLDYTLNLTTDLTPEQVMQFVTTSVTSYKQTHATDAVGRGLTVSVITKTKLGQDIAEEEFGVRPTVGVVFHVVPSQGYDDGVRNMIQTTVVLLKSVTGDAVMLKGGELFMLQRKGDEIIIGEDWHRQFASALDTEGIAYEKREVVTPAA